MANTACPWPTTTISQDRETFDGAITFDAAGEIGLIKASFLDYGAEIVARSEQGEFQRTQSLRQGTYRDYQGDNISGVNLDEEMSNLIVIQQSYGASARVITTIQSMFEALEQAFEPCPGNLPVSQGRSPPCSAAIAS